MLGWSLPLKFYAHAITANQSQIVTCKSKPGGAPGMRSYTDSQGRYLKALAVWTGSKVLSSGCPPTPPWNPAGDAMATRMCKGPAVVHRPLNLAPKSLKKRLRIGITGLPIRVQHVTDAMSGVLLKPVHRWCSGAVCLHPSGFEMPDKGLEGQFRPIFV